MPSSGLKKKCKLQGTWMGLGQRRDVRGQSWGQLETDSLDSLKLSPAALLAGG